MPATSWYDENANRAFPFLTGTVGRSFARRMIGGVAYDPGEAMTCQLFHQEALETVVIHAQLQITLASDPGFASPLVDVSTAVSTVGWTYLAEDGTVSAFPPGGYVSHCDLALHDPTTYRVGKARYTPTLPDGDYIARQVLFFADPDAGTPCLPSSLRHLPSDAIVDCGFVLGGSSDFDPAVHSIFLYRVTREDDVITFTFRSDAPSLAGRDLAFAAPVDQTDFVLQEASTDDTAGADHHYSISFATGREVFDLVEGELWSGYVVLGPMATLAAMLPENTSWTRPDDHAAIVEPALIYSQAGSTIDAINLANSDRTRATGPVSSQQPTWPFQTGVIFTQAVGLQGQVLFKPGYNCTMYQNDRDNSVTISASSQAGEGKLCNEQVPLFAGETPPDGSPNPFLDGGMPCGDTLRAINGMGGPIVNFIAGNGVSIIPDPDNHKIVIDFDMRGMAVCSPESQG